MWFGNITRYNSVLLDIECLYNISITTCVVSSSIIKWDITMNDCVILQNIIECDIWINNCAIS